ncbi:MAG: 5'-methylthioadenosine nucleosidase [Planctomycetaceae bacterium]|nr:5'-methylthioadenosine nucleosidase [Planctomycetaceae bacterium]
MPRTPAESPADDTSRADVGLVCALSMELNYFFDRCEKVRTLSGAGFRFRGGRLNGIRVASVESGAGMKKAARAACALIDGHAPAWIIACGFAGALRAGVKIGDIVVSESVTTPLGAAITTPHGMSSDPSNGLHVGRVLTADKIVRLVKDKQALAHQFDAIACDMESYAVAEVCRDAKTPFMIVRSVTDDLSADLPAEVHALLASTGAGRLGATVGALWNRPESVKDLWKLREHATVAARRLAPFLASVVEQLHAAKAGQRV